MTYIKYVFNFFKSIYTGMSITLYYFLRPSEVVTMQYPDEKWEVPPRFRGFHTVAFEGAEACIGCLQCQRICSERAIRIKTSLGEDKKRKVDEFIINLGVCSFCGNCQEACPVKAIKMGGGYEGSKLSKNELILNREKLRRTPIAKPAPAPIETEAKTNA